MNFMTFKAGLLAKKTALKIVYGSNKPYLIFFVPSDPNSDIFSDRMLFPKDSAFILTGNNLTVNGAGSLEIYPDNVIMLETIEFGTKAYAELEDMYDRYLLMLKEEEAEREKARQKESGIILPSEPGKIIV